MDYNSLLIKMDEIEKEYRDVGITLEKRNMDNSYIQTFLDGYGINCMELFSCEKLIEELFDLEFKVKIWHSKLKTEKRFETSVSVNLDIVDVLNNYISPFNDLGFYIGCDDSFCGCTLSKHSFVSSAKEFVELVEKYTIFAKKFKIAFNI